MKKIFTLFAALFLLGVSCLAQTSSSWYWATYGDYDFDEGISVATDANANTYMTGYNGAGGYDEYIIKFDSSGNVKWFKQATNLHEAQMTIGWCVAVDNSGNSYVTGQFDDTITMDSHTLAADTSDMFLVKYDSGGNVLWARQSVLQTSHSLCLGFGATCDKEGNTYVTGEFKDTVSFGPYTLSGNGINSFIVKYDSNGNVIWANQTKKLHFVTYEVQGINSIAIDKFKNSYVTGIFMDTISFGATTLTTANAFAMFVAKYDSNGNFLWAKQSGTYYIGDYSYLKESNAITTDTKNGIYVTGNYSHTLVYGKVNLTDAPDCSDVFLMKLDTAGNAIWGVSSKSLEGSEWQGYSVSADTIDNIYISCGERSGNDRADTIQFGQDTLTISNVSQDGNTAIVKFDSSGNVLCSSIIGGGGDDWSGIAVTPSGKNVYFGGDLETAVRFGVDSLSYYGNELPFMSHWKPCISCNLSVTMSPISPVICSGNPATLIAAGAQNYTWSPGNSLNSTTGDSVTATPSVTTTYTIIGTTGSCVDTAQAIVTVDSLPVVTIQPLLPAICYGESIALTASGATTYQWTPSIGLSATSGSLVSANPTITSIYVITGSNGSCSDSIPITVTVTSVTLNVNSSVVCSGNATTLKVTGAQNYTWMPATGLSVTTGDSVIASPTANTTYTITGTENGCSDTVQSTVTIIPAPNKPAITVSVTGDSLISSAISYNQWYFNGVQITDSTRQVLVIKGHSKGWYSVTVTNPANGCSTSSDSTTSINQLSIINNEVSIYPNPTNSSVFIKINSAAPINNWSLQIKDVLGRTVYKIQTLNYLNEVDMVKFPPEIYFISITNGNDSGVFKIVKQE